MTPRKFKSVDHAVSKLVEFGQAFTYDKRRNVHRKLERKEIFVGSTLRAFHGMSPAEKLDQFMDSHSANIAKYLNGIRNLHDFKELQAQTIKWLNQGWNVESRNPNEYLTYGQASKLVNLIFKVYNETTFIANYRLKYYLEIPFDSFTLRPLASILNNLLMEENRISLPMTATMNYIVHLEHYNKIHHAVDILCERAGVPTIYYEYYCWDRCHPGSLYYQF